MALWDNTGIKTVDDAFIFNQLWNTKSLALMARVRPLLTAALGEMTPAQTPLGSTSFKRLKKVTGNKIEARFLGKTATPGYLATPAAELTPIDFASAYANDYWGSQTFDLAFMHYTHPIPQSEIDRIGGKEAKTEDYLDEINQLLVQSWLKKYGTEFHAAQAPARGAIGGWQWAVSDGVEAAGAYALYGTIDRSAAGNGDFQSYVLDAAGSFSPKKHRKVRNRISKNTATARLAVVDEDGYTEVETMLDGYTVINQDNGNLWRSFEGEYVQLGRVKFALDADAPANTIGYFDPDFIGVWCKDAPFTQKGIQEIDTLPAGYGVKTKAWIQMIFQKPSACGKVNNAFSAA